MDKTLHLIDFSSPSTDKFNFNFYNVGMILLIILSQYNVAKWGATLSYVAIPGIFFLFGAFFSKTKFDKNAFLIFGLFSVYFISTFFSSYVLVGREIASFFVFCIFYVLAVSNKFSVKEIRVFLFVYIIVACSASFNICFNWLAHNYVQDWTKRSTFVFLGVMKDPNYTFAYICPAFVISVLLFFQNKKFWVRFVSALSILSTFAALFCASTRAGMLSIAVSLILIPLFCSQLSKKTRITIMLITVFGALLGYLIITKTYSEYALKRFTDDKDGSGRFDIWMYALKVFKEHPILGGGFNSGSSISLANEGHTSHSVVFDILCDSGILGMLAFFIFYFENCFWSDWENFELQVVLSASALIPLFFINGFNTTTFYYPLILLCLIRKTAMECDYSVLFTFGEEPSKITLSLE